ncbi:DUF4384 domain-containing protein [Candidatus Poribacteria bacterium]|nr:DUF4384 domain-containing protein [Candidatus Poribacteria bacterium]
MRHILCAISFYLLLSSTLTFAQEKSFDEQVESVMASLLSQMTVESEARVYIQPPVYLDPNAKALPERSIGGPFARYLRAACEASLTPQFKLIPRDELAQIWSEVNLAQVTASQDPDAVLQGLQSLVTQQATLPLDAIVMVEYSEWMGNLSQIRLNLYLIDVRRVRKYTAVGTLHLTQAQATDAPARPENYDQIRLQTEQISHIVHDEVQAVASASDEMFFDLFVTVDKGPGAVYVDGESLTVRVSAEIDGYIAVINIDATGEMHLLFPNAHERENFIRSGEGRQIPAPDRGDYDLAIGEPFGFETIKVFASRTQFPVESALRKSKDLNLVPFPRLGTRAAQGVKTIKSWAKAVVERDKQRARLAEAQCFFTTIPQSSKGIWKD